MRPYKLSIPGGMGRQNLRHNAQHSRVSNKSRMDFETFKNIADAVGGADTAKHIIDEHLKKTGSNTHEVRQYIHNHAERYADEAKFSRLHDRFRANQWDKRLGHNVQNTNQEFKHKWKERPNLVKPDIYNNKTSHNPATPDQYRRADQHCTRPANLSQNLNKTNPNQQKSWWDKLTGK
jgi:hypothetical protein